MKKCSCCKQEKEFSEFGKNASSKDGLYCYCKICRPRYTAEYRRKNGQSIRNRKREDWHKNSKEYRIKQREIRLKSVYGIDSQKYQEMLAKQNGLCAICESPEIMKFKGKTKRLSIDHCHETGAIRGRLCSKCNSAIGLFDSRPARMERAMTYVFVGGFDGLA